MYMKLSRIAAASLLSLCLVSEAQARPDYTARLPSNFSCGTCHLSPSGGGARNPFGEDFLDNGLAWSSDLCAKDSDGDGFSNGAELGDPDCMWASGQPRPMAVSNPGNANSRPPVVEMDMGGGQDMDPGMDMGGEQDMGAVAPGADMGGNNPVADMSGTPADMGQTEAPRPGTPSEDDDEGCAQVGAPAGRPQTIPGLLLCAIAGAAAMRRRRK